jgi:type I restriction enzyme S subunit
VKYKTYSNYKDSGIEWLGEIPSDWNLVKLKYLVSITTGNKDTENKELDGKYPFFVRSKNIEKINSYSYDGEAILTAGDGDIGKIFHYINGKFDFHQRVYMFYKFKNILVKFLYFYLQENLYKEVIKLSAKTTVDSLRLPMLQDFIITIPSKQEQQQIANFLDNSTAKIDNLIEKQTKLIELLKEKRQAVISNAVTKGIKEDNSTWKTFRIDWISTIVRGNTGFKKDELLSRGKYVALQYGKTYKVDEVNELFEFYVNDEFFKSNQVVNYGDSILISTSETVEDLGHSCFYNRNDLGLIGGEQILLKPNTKVVFDKYLYYVSKVFNGQLKKYATGLKVFRFNIDDLKNIFISIPSVEEQLKIANYLDNKTLKIDTLIEKAKKSIELLKEKRKALISEAVTGKIDVRGMV